MKAASLTQFKYVTYKQRLQNSQMKQITKQKGQTDLRVTDCT